MVKAYGAGKRALRIREFLYTKFPEIKNNEVEFKYAAKVREEGSKYSERRRGGRATERELQHGRRSFRLQVLCIFMDGIRAPITIADLVNQGASKQIMVALQGDTGIRGRDGKEHERWLPLTIHNELTGKLADGLPKGSKKKKMPGREELPKIMKAVKLVLLTPSCLRSSLLPVPLCFLSPSPPLSSLHPPPLSFLLLPPSSSPLLPPRLIFPVLLLLQSFERVAQVQLELRPPILDPDEPPPLPTAQKVGELMGKIRFMKESYEDVRRLFPLLLSLTFPPDRRPADRRGPLGQGGGRGGQRVSDYYPPRRDHGAICAAVCARDLVQGH
eukprot:764898-Hanusia_phi.AAC.9